MISFIRRRWLPLLLAVVVLGGGGTYFHCGWHMPVRAVRASKSKVLYRCPMHPQHTSDRPGDCPICGMKLVAVEEQPRPRGARAPRSTGSEPALSAAKGQASPAGAVTPEGGRARRATREAPAVAGQATVYLTPEKQQFIGLRTGLAQRSPMTKVLRAVGQVTVDETRVTRIHTKVAGWVDKLYVNFTGAAVRKGQPLLSIYSPDLVATQEEYLLALRARERLHNSSFPEVAQGGDSLLAATRRRLELWDVPESEIRRIERAGRPIKTLTLHAPVSGYVMDKPVLAGQRVDPSTELMVVADLDSVWVEAEFYEEDASLVRVGDRATMTVSSYPEMSWTGAIDYIFPAVDAQTRTLRARLRFANRGMVLRPGMYATVLIEKPLGYQLTVPKEAVLDSGTRQIVFLDRGDGHFEPREVRLGQRADDRVEVLSGLAAGDRIVTAGNFLIDSESRLQSALQGMQPAPGHEHRTQAGAAVPPAPAKRAAGKPSGHEGMPGMPGM